MKGRGQEDKGEGEKRRDEGEGREEARFREVRGRKLREKNLGKSKVY